MRPSAMAVVGALVGSACVVAPLAGQGYQLRLDTRFQSVSFHDVNDQQIRGAPLVSTLDAAFWGFGLRGVSIRTRSRLGTDLLDTTAWPGTEPTIQLVEAYGEYASRLVTAQVGRTHNVSRLGYTGFDGARVNVRPWRGLRASAYGGWGLARAVPLPLTSPAINPLNEFVPTDRQIVLGLVLGWSTPKVDANVVWQREQVSSDGSASALAGLRGAADVAVRPFRGWTVTGAAEFDFARYEANGLDGQVTYRDAQGRFQLTGGARFYKPYFDLWTIWGVFSPTPFSAGFGTARVTPLRGLELWTTGETYKFWDSGVAAPLAVVKDDGWRWSVGGTFTRMRRVTLGAGYHVEATNGASSLGFDAKGAYSLFRSLSLEVVGGYRLRPLEYRINDSKVWNYGLRVDWLPVNGVIVNAGAVRYDQRLAREGTGQSFGDWRFHLGLTLSYGSGADTPSLHPAILRIPERRPQ